jgi:ABC-type transporter Mla maintaining outer membrane lipid asymmetry ATPase subunit MlaF
MNAPAQIELLDVAVARESEPDRILVQGVTWTIAKGEWWAIAGDSASGKSSLLSTAAGLSAPAAGVVRIFGKDLSGASEGELVASRREIGFVFENGGHLLSGLSVAENVGLPLCYHDNLYVHEARQRVEELLALAGLEAFADRLPSRLSPAIRQRVALLRALVVPVRVLFLDDPLRGLAPRDAAWWLGFLRQLRARSAGALSLVVSGYDLAAWRGDATCFAEVAEGRFRVAAQGEAP